MSLLFLTNFQWFLNGFPTFLKNWSEEGKKKTLNEIPMFEKVNPWSTAAQPTQDQPTES